MGSMPFASFYRGRESFCCWKIALLGSFYVIQEVLVAEVTGSEAWKHPAQNSQKATVIPLLQVTPFATRKHGKKNLYSCKTLDYSIVHNLGIQTG